MKKSLAFFLSSISILLTLFIMNACSVEKKEQADSIETKKVPSIISNKEDQPAEASIGNGPVALANHFLKDIPSKEALKASVKKIPFRDLLRANISFTENKGQLERFENLYYPEIGGVKFYSKAFCGNAYFGKSGIGFGFQRGGLRDVDVEVNHVEKEYLTKAERHDRIGFFIAFKGSNPDVQISGVNEQHTKTNYLKGNIPELFVTDIASYEKVNYKGLYKGIDLVYYMAEGQLKYDYLVAPNADINQIKMDYKNVRKLSINKKGELEISIDWGTLYDRKPYSYQEINGVKKEVPVIFAMLDDKTVGFKVNGKYDKSKPLVIDPFTLEWSTYIGTATSDNGYIESTCIDNSERVLGTGWTNNAFPVGASPNGYDKSYNNGSDTYVFRLNTTGTAMDYVTYLGGGGNETGTGILVNSIGEICVSGFTESFATTAIIENITSTHTIGLGSINVTVNGIGNYGFGWEIFMVNGANIMYGTITGFPNGTTLTLNVTSIVGTGTFGTWATNRIINAPFPTTIGSIQPVKDGLNALADIFYVKLNGAGNNLIYGTHYGRNDTDWAVDLALDASNNAYLTGRTQSDATFATAGVYKTTPQGGFDAFALKINANGTLGYCTFVGGAANDIGKGVVTNSLGELYITGMTGSTGQATIGAFQTAFGGLDDAFVAKLTTIGTIAYFTYVGGTGQDCGSGIDIIPSNNEVVIVGTTASNNFPLLAPFDNTYTNAEGFITRIRPNGNALRYSSFIGGDGQDNTKGFDYTTVHKNGGVKIALPSGKPVVVLGINSTPGSMTPFLVSPLAYTAINQSDVLYGVNGGAFSGGTLGDFFITVFDSTAQNVELGSYFGGAQDDYPTAGINILQSSGCVVFGGGVHSLPFPVTAAVFQTKRVPNVANDQPAILKVCLPEILPIQLLNFNAVRQQGSVQLTWATSSELNNKAFDIMKSADGINFYSIGQVKGAGTSSSISYYYFTDNEINQGVVYYKIKQTDEDGRYTFSSIKTVNVPSFENLSIMPNPGNGLVKILTYFAQETVLEIRVQNVLEQEVFYLNETVPAGVYERVLNLLDLSSGMYILQFTAGEQARAIKYVKE